MPKTLQYQQWAKPLITAAVVPAPDGTAADAYQLPDPPRPARRLTAEPVSLFVAWPVPARAAVAGAAEWLTRNEEVPHRVPRFIQDPPTRYAPQPLDSAPPAPTWDPRPADFIDSRPLRSGQRAGSIALVVTPLAPVSGRVEPSAAESVVWARLPELPRPPKRVPQPSGVTAPDISGDRPVYAWARRLPEIPTRGRPRLTNPASDTTPLAYPRLPLEWNRLQEVPAPIRRRSLPGPFLAAPIREPLPRFFAAENVLPNLWRKRLPLEGVRVAPLVQFVPQWFQAETVTPTLRRRLVSPVAAPFVPPQHVIPVYIPVPTERPVPLRRRVLTLPADGRVDVGGPAVPRLAWFVAHELPRRLQPRWAYEFPAFAFDLGRTLLRTDDRDSGGANTRGATSTGGSGRNRTSTGVSSQG